MDFVIQWLWYLLAFVTGSAAAWLIAAALGKVRGQR
ncbi:channel accessory protein ArfB [Mycobacterium shigaense]|uniref:Putative membrane protein ArfB n=1 Tax=Mycobacterium shigaense TaxID=722731 RepID=A0A1Z4EMP4_9MYCO|nr:putative membrane protein ArfB [Mycobacterium shigaense]